MEENNGEFDFAAKLEQKWKFCRKTSLKIRRALAVIPTIIEDPGAFKLSNGSTFLGETSINSCYYLLHCEVLKMRGASRHAPNPNVRIREVSTELKQRRASR